MTKELIDKFKLTETEYSAKFGNWWESPLLPNLKRFSISDSGKEGVVIVWAVLEIGGKLWQYYTEYTIELLLDDSAIVFIADQIIPRGKDALMVLQLGNKNPTRRNEAG